MIVEPKVRGFICTTAHPEGCRQAVKNQIDYVKAQPMTQGPKKVLIIGSSTGYGLASRIAAAFSCSAATLGVMFEKPASGNRTATAGWYNTAAFEEFASVDGLYSKTINGDAFSAEVKRQVIDLIRRDLGRVDMVVYSLAAPRRAMADGSVYSSVLKTTEGAYANKTIDLKTRKISPVSIPQATEEEIEATVKVMGGEDWKDWIQALRDADAIEPDAVTVAYSYIGPEITHPIYKDGSIGQAKKHLARTAREITAEFGGIRGYISVNKALVTQSSAAIPIVPLYISVLYRVMKEQGCHEGCIQQMYRLFHDKLLQARPPVDGEGFLRLDDLEMQPRVQEAVQNVWSSISDDTVDTLADIDGYWEDFYQMFGFRIPGVDYAADVDVNRPIPSMDA